MSQDALGNTLIPFTRELQKRNDQLEALQSLPLYNAPLEIERKIVTVDLDVGLLSDTHRNNLHEMKLDLPSKVYSGNTVDAALEAIKVWGRRLGQLASTKTTIGKNVNDDEREVYRSQQETLRIYKKSILALRGAEAFTGQGLVRPKRGRGCPRKHPKIFYYNNADELCERLDELVAAKRAGNTGLDNDINAILDELLKLKCVDKDAYDLLYKNIFR